MMLSRDKSIQPPAARSLRPFWDYLVFIFVLYGYVWLVQENGGLSAEWFVGQWLELALVSYFYGFLYINLQPVRGRAVIAALPVLVGYLAHDLYFQMLGKVLRLVDIQELPELLQVLPLAEAGVVLAVLIVPLLLAVLLFNYRQPRRLILSSLPLVAVVCGMPLAPGSIAATLDSLALNIVKYSDSKSVERNGRYTMLMYREAQRISTREHTEPYYDRETYDAHASERAAYVGKHGNRRNVHLLVLESFLDPELFKDARFSQPPAHPAFRHLIGDKQGLAVSPQFGGATAQAEFELLCGVPAFERLASVEFNAFTGAAAYCLPGLLEKVGYHSIASNAYKPDFFNELSAYQGMGFSDINFPREYTSGGDSYLSVADAGIESFAFDSVVLDQNLTYIKWKLAEQTHKPLFNYVMTIYGHTPHILDAVQRPEFIRVESSFEDDHFIRAVNQYYYRTEAIADYVRKLMEIDRNSLIILISDHVPPLRFGLITYDELRYMDNVERSYYYNRVIFIENGVVVRQPTFKYFDMPQIVFNYLTEGRYCRQNTCDFLNDTPSKSQDALMARYMSLMAHASE